MGFLLQKLYMFLVENLENIETKKQRKRKKTKEIPYPTKKAGDGEMMADWAERHVEY